MERKVVACMVGSLWACQSTRAMEAQPSTAPPPAAIETHAACAGPSTPTVDRALLARPPALARDIGWVRQRATTSSPEAFTYYEQGMAYLHGYVWIEAARSFHQALRLDPEFAMAWVGLSRTESGMLYGRQAAEAASKAAALAARGGRLGETEKRLAELRVMQLAALAAPPEKQTDAHQAYKLAIEKAIAADPDDAELWILRGQAEESGPWGRGQGGGIGAIAFYEAALARAPQHHAAHHYLTHAYENVGRHREAERHARIYSEAAARVPHALHMLGHILPRLGKWEDALTLFERADALEREYARVEKLKPGEDWHHAHNLVLLGYTYLRLARPIDAERAFRRMFDTPIWVPGYVAFRGTWPEFLLLRGQPGPALVAARKLAGHPFAGARAVGRALEAEALIDLDRAGEARDALAAAAVELASARKAGGPSLRLVDQLSAPVVEAAEAVVLLHSHGQEQQGEAVTMALAGRVAANPRFDAWGEGLFRLERIARHARAVGREPLARAVRGKMSEIDPGYTPGAWSAKAQARR